MITVRFGLHLDGAHTAIPEGKVGHATLGSMGLLGMLELHLGLSGVFPSQAQRVVQYRACLRKNDSPERFFHASLLTDELGTSAELLTWRDLWFVHGWDGQASDGFSKRLLDIAEVERHAARAVSPSVGQRLRQVLGILEYRKPPIESIEVIDPECALPLMWQQVLSRLPTRFVTMRRAAASNSMLGQLQARLELAAEHPRGPLPWIDDGTLQVVQADSLLLAGRWFGDRLSTKVGSRLVVADDHAQLLDDVLAGNALPRQGFGEQSAFRPSLQVLPLAMALMWDPLDISACLEFLTHPLCPLPREVTRKLAGKLSDRPGLRRQDVDVEIPDLLQRFTARADEVRHQIDHWLFPQRHTQAQGVPISEALARVQRLAAHFRSHLFRANAEDGTALGAAHSQCRALELSLGQLLIQGVSRLTAVQLAKLIAQATSNGSVNPLLKAESGCALSTANPGAITQPVDHVFWWQLKAPAMPRPYPWSRAEIRELAAAGVRIPSTGEQLQQLAAEWLRPLLAAERSLTLVLPASGEELHPVWQLLSCHISGVPVVSLESLLTRGAEPSAMLPATTREIPVKKRWWTLPAGAIPVSSGRASSFSALDLYLNNPYQWVLTYPAQLRTSRILSLPDEFRLSGSLTHKLVERLFERPDAQAMTATELGQWIDRALDELIEAEGAVLLAPGRQVERERFRRTARRAVEQLMANLRSASVEKIEPEYALGGTFSGGEMMGFADLVVTNRLGERAIIDMKWGGGKRYREKLAKNAHLQLIIYAGLLHQQTQQWPHAAYYILSGANLLAYSADFFADADTPKAAERQTSAQLWQRFEATWKWRRDQLQSGLCEIVMDDIPDDPQSIPPESALPLESLNPQYNDFVHLAGWDRS